jgi:hypothetical protein
MERTASFSSGVRVSIASIHRTGSGSIIGAG